MSCTTRFLNLQWQHHSWRQRVTSAETLPNCPETDMWARPVYRDYVRCDKQKVCEECGATRPAVSCLCDPARAERCVLLREFIDSCQATAEPRLSRD